jgi:hypothetical protein
MNIELYKTDNGVAIISNLCNFIVSLQDIMLSDIIIYQTNLRDRRNCNTEVEALFDYNGKDNTEKMLCSKVANLKEGEYIPTLGQLAIMYKVKDELNFLLEECGGKKIDDSYTSYYYSSSRYKDSRNWHINFNRGFMVDIEEDCNMANIVRPVRDLKIKNSDNPLSKILRKLGLLDPMTKYYE